MFLKSSLFAPKVENAEKIDSRITEFLKIFNDKYADTLKFFSWFDDINKARNQENSEKFFLDFFYTFPFDSKVEVLKRINSYISGAEKNLAKDEDSKPVKKTKFYREWEKNWVQQNFGPTINDGYVAFLKDQRDKLGDKMFNSSINGTYSYYKGIPSVSVYSPSSLEEMAKNRNKYTKTVEQLTLDINQNSRWSTLVETRDLCTKFLGKDRTLKVDFIVANPDAHIFGKKSCLEVVDGFILELEIIKAKFEYYFDVLDGEGVKNTLEDFSKVQTGYEDFFKNKTYFSEQELSQINQNLDFKKVKAELKSKYPSINNFSDIAKIEDGWFESKDSVILENFTFAELGLGTSLADFADEYKLATELNLKNREEVPINACFGSDGRLLNRKFIGKTYLSVKNVDLKDDLNTSYVTVGQFIQMQNYAKADKNKDNPIVIKNYLNSLGNLKQKFLYYRDLIKESKLDEQEKYHDMVVLTRVYRFTKQKFLERMSLNQI